MNEPDALLSPFQGGDDAFSAMFLVPHDVPVPLLIEDKRNANTQDRLMVWIAVGLAAVCIVGGLLYHLYYLRVGNEVTAMLPRETVAYVRIGQPARLQEAFANLSMWQTTRPVRERLHDHEQDLMEHVLLDIGVNATMLDQLKSGLGKLHIAALQPETSRKTGLPYDLLFFMEFDEPDARRDFLARVTRFFEPAGEAGGVPVLLRRLHSGSLTMANLDEMVILCLGSQTALRHVLENRERGPNRSLNDAPGFRAAYRANAHDSGRDLWAYVRHDQLVDISINRILAPLLVEEQRLALAPYSLLLKDSDLDGAGIAIDVAGGMDAGRIGFYASTGEAFEDVAEQTGNQPMGTLSAIPPGALMVFAGSLEDPTALFSTWRGPVLHMLRDLGFFGPGGELGLDINRLQAESGVYLESDVWPNLAKEMAIAYLPGDRPGDLTWLLAFRVHSTPRAMDVVSRLARHMYTEERGRTFRRRYPFRYEDGIYRIKEIKERPDGRGGMKVVRQGDVLCWTSIGQMVLVAPSCDTIDEAVWAESNDRGMNIVAKTALQTLPETATIVLIGRLKDTLQRLLGPKKVFSLLSDDFIAAASFAIFPDRIELASNVSALSLGFLWTTAALDDGTDGGGDPCRELVAHVCEQVGATSDECADYKTKVAGASPSSCSTGLRTMRSFDAM